ncbi:MAG: hypothetical protein FWH55_10685 [Oscillospiraceae bacterium]|nr:hypothetical protein [Oscillospiraceae bacterium]
MDMGGAALRVFARLLHCGGILTKDQERNIRQFDRFLFFTIEKQKQFFEGKMSRGLWNTATRIFFETRTRRMCCA